jgi:small subunit ribosomal protein S17
MSEAKENKRLMLGKVVSSKMDKTIVVEIERLVPHPLYGKYIRRSTKVHAHDAANECREGDVVQLVSARPLSKRKAWVLEKVITRAS